jgi:hypothetical protein
MRVLLIDPFNREIHAVEGDPEALMRTSIRSPQGMVDITPELGMVCCPLGTIGDGIQLWWHSGLGEVFGGMAMLVGLGGDDYFTGVPEGSWLAARRAVEFLGTGEPALERLHELVSGAMRGNEPDDRQGVLPLEPRDDPYGR